MKIFTFLSIMTLTATSMVSAASFEPENETINILYNASTPDSTDRAILQFCKDLIANTTDSTFLQVRETVGKIIYLYELDKTKLATIITSSDIKGTTTKLDLQFSKAMNELTQALLKLKINHQIAGIQNGSIALEEQIPRVIARCLLTKEGTVNFGIIQSLKQNFLSTITSSYQKDIARFLDLLTTLGQNETQTAAWENIFKSVTKPVSSTSASNDLIRATLKLPADTSITNNHAKEVFLYLFMGHARQGPAGNCFEEWWKILVKDGLWHTLARDGIQLLKYGALVRNINGVQQNFPFSYSIADDALQNSVNLDQKGTIRGSMNLFDVPGFYAAAQQMGIQDPKSVLNNVLSILLESTTNATVTAEQIITAAAQAAIKLGLNQQKNLETLTKLGFFAFSSESTCAPLNLYGSCLASFAEALETNHVRGRALHAVEESLDSQWHSKAFFWEFPAIDRAKDLFLDTLNAQIAFYYNERIALVSPSADGSSTAGAFEMHRATGELISGPNDFQKLIIDVLEMTKTAAGQLAKNSLLNQLSLKSMQSSLDRVANYISKNQNFLKLLLWNYNADNKKHPDPVTNWQSLEHTPWLDQTGNDPNAVFDIATGMMLPKATSVIPKNAHQLASSFVQFARTLEKNQHYLENPNFIGRIPVWNPIHAYTGRLDDTAMIDAVKSMLSVEDWLSKRLFQSGYTISKGMIPKDVAENLRKTLADALSESDQQTFLSKTIGAYQDSICVRDFARKLIKTLTSMDSRYAGAQIYAQVSQILTATLLKTLPMNMITTLTTSAIQAFDTNWYDMDNNQGMLTEARDIHFCFFFDPVSEDILFGTVDEDGTELRLIDQDEWVNGQQWEFVPAVLVDSAG